MDKKDIKEKDESLEKLLKLISEKEEKFWVSYWGDERVTAELLDKAMAINNLQKGAIQNLIAKVKILESSK